MIAFPALARRFGVGRLVVLGAAAFGLRAALWGLAPTPAVALLVSPLGGIAFGFFYVGIVTFVSRAIPAEAQATAQSVYSGMTFSLGSVVGTALAGGLAPILGLPGLFMASAAGRPSPGPSWSPAASPWRGDPRGSCRPRRRQYRCR